MFGNKAGVDNDCMEKYPGTHRGFESSEMISYIQASPHIQTLTEGIPFQTDKLLEHWGYLGYKQQTQHNAAQNARHSKPPEAMADDGKARKSNRSH